MLIEFRLVDTFFASRTFLKLTGFFTFMQKVLVYSLNLDDLGAMFALRENRAISPVVKILFFWISKTRVFKSTELTFAHIFLS
jgi:hypothetical protein